MARERDGGADRAAMGHDPMLRRVIGSERAEKVVPAFGQVGKRLAARRAESSRIAGPRIDVVAADIGPTASFPLTEVKLAQPRIVTGTFGRGEDLSSCEFPMEQFGKPRAPREGAGMDSDRAGASRAVGPFE